MYVILKAIHNYVCIIIHMYTHRIHTCIIYIYMQHTLVDIYSVPPSSHACVPRQAMSATKGLACGPQETATTSTVDWENMGKHGKTWENMGKHGKSHGFKHQ